MAEIREKIELRDKNSEAQLTSDTNLHAQLRWKKAVDLDLYAFWEDKNGNRGKIYYGHKSDKGITLDQDAGVGDTGGDNEENMNIQSLAEMKHILIVANIYGKNTAFCKYDGAVMVESGGQQIEVPLTSKVSGSWCIVTHLDNSSPIGAKLVNINTVHSVEPNIPAFLDGSLQEASGGGGGFLGGLFS